MPYIYRHIRLDKNEPFYIGIGSDTNYKRSKDFHSRNKIWKSIASRSDYEIEILLDNLTVEESKIKEIEFINLYKRIIDNGILANLSLGGESNKGYKRSIEAINKTANSNKCRIVSEEVKKIISDKLKGRKLSLETREKMSIRMTGNTYTKGKKLTDAHKLKISQSNLGRKHKK
jgi:hypothetical protein